MDLEKKRIVILGGSSGIGFAVARAAAQAGAELVIASSRKANIDHGLADLPQSAQGHAIDLSDEARICSLFEGIGPFDHLVYTAGENLKLRALKSTEARRFWTWDGKPTKIVSRSTDEQGNVQPNRAALIAKMGTNALFHYNAQQTWRIDAGGKVTNVLA